MVSEFTGGEASPNAELLHSVGGVVPAGVYEWTVGAEGSSGFDGLVAEFGIFNVLREEYFWQPFARYFTHARNFEHEFAVWMSEVEHTLNPNSETEQVDD